jgi:hypothetical protein
MSKNIARVLLFLGIAMELVSISIFFTASGSEDTIGLYLLLLLAIPVIIIFISVGAIKLFGPITLASAGAVVCIASLMPIYFKEELIRLFRLYNTIPFTIFFVLGIILLAGSIGKFFLGRSSKSRKA